MEIDGIKVLAWQWYNSYECVGVVLVKTEVGEIKAYIGVGNSNCEIQDIAKIMKFGCKLPLNVAYEIFPRFKPDKEII